MVMHVDDQVTVIAIVCSITVTVIILMIIFCLCCKKCEKGCLKISLWRYSRKFGGDRQRILDPVEKNEKDAKLKEKHDAIRQKYGIPVTSAVDVSETKKDKKKDKKQNKPQEASSGDKAIKGQTVKSGSKSKF